MHENETTALEHMTLMQSYVTRIRVHVCVRPGNPSKVTRPSFGRVHVRVWDRDYVSTRRYNGSLLHSPDIYPAELHCPVPRPLPCTHDKVQHPHFKLSYYTYAPSLFRVTLPSLYPFFLSFPLSLPFSSSFPPSCLFPILSLRTLTVVS